MKKYSLLILAIIFNNVIALACNDHLHHKIKDASDEYLSTRFMNGVYMFADDKGLITKGAKGFHSITSKKKLNADQQMPIASATKTMTAVAILKLQERGLLNVQDKISKHLNADSGIWKNGKVPTWANDVTIHNMLTHRSGIAEYFMKSKIDVSVSLEDINKQIANFAASQKLAFKPGEKHDYNNTNFVLLGLIIEKVSKQKAGEFFEKELFAPLGMKNTKIANLADALKQQADQDSTPEIATRYFVTPTGAKPQFNVARHPFIMTPFTDGGVTSTTADLITWHKALHSGKVLSDASYKQMTTGYYEAPSKTKGKTRLGYGIYMTELENGDILYHHAGNALAIRSESGCIPKKGLCFAVLSNVMNYVPKEMQNKIDMTQKVNQLDIIHYTRHILKSL